MAVGGRALCRRTSRAAPGSTQPVLVVHDGGWPTAARLQAPAAFVDGTGLGVDHRPADQPAEWVVNRESGFQGHWRRAAIDRVADELVAAVRVCRREEKPDRRQVGLEIRMEAVTTRGLSAF